MIFISLTNEYKVSIGMILLDFSLYLVYSNNISTIYPTLIIISFHTLNVSFVMVEYL